MRNHTKCGQNVSRVININININYWAVAFIVITVHIYYYHTMANWLFPIEEICHCHYCTSTLKC